MDFGQSLKRERERQVATLEAISEATKVPVRQLDALERNDAHELPGGVFNRGIVQSYCRYLGLDENEWLDRYHQIHQPTEQDWSGFAEAVKRGRAPATPLVQRRWWGVLLMLLALAALAWAAWHFIIRPRVGKPATGSGFDSASVQNW